MHTGSFESFPESERDRKIRLEAPYIEELRTSEHATVLAAHATTLEKAALASVVGNILPGDSGIRLAGLVLGGEPKHSAHITQDVRFSVWEVNPQYSIDEYTAGV